ncbi:sphingosine-1-phosphate phosphatase 1 isoform X2 [Larimichthys crocea]|uniref:sphingosine-1-phosphate phosphatase 1 isoform X2 n=1 Tax=Larimichthys crocea TaxID=215358 RepID=UPI000F5D9BE8|nr:sphingosine-1-phosphate phosphatase 1 isoform X2 [Larimichthys crocea]
MEKSSRIVELYYYLQDPHHVARFQRICGVRGTFSRTVSAGSTATISSSSKEADRSHSHNNGACHHHSTAENEGESLAVMGAGEGEEVQTTAGVRKRTVESIGVKNSGEEAGNAAQNGAAVSAATAGGETVGVGSNGRSLAGATAAGQGATESEKTGPEKDCEGPQASSTLKPLRKNSLTGDAGQEFLIENRFLFYLFTFGTELGNELFYITFFPWVMWNMDAFVSRRLIMVWVWVMYLGQCTKDVLGWSRPASPPVVKVEMFYNSEYSMPSTHAMSGTAIPFSLFFLTYGRWEYPFSLGFSLALCWCLVVCVSRIYMGMHSILDVIAGVLYSSLILLFFLPALDLIDSFNLTCRYAPLIIISFHLGLGLFSFNLDTWSTSRGDTAQILGTGAGVALASHVNHLLGLMPDPTPEQLPFTFPTLSTGLVGVAMLRFVLGVLALVATRALMKAITIPLVCWVFGVPSGDVRKARQHMEVELPYRYIVYGTVGFNVLFLVPLLFSYMQLSREEAAAKLVER